MDHALGGAKALDIALVVAGDVDVLGVGFPQRPGDLGPQDRQDFPGLVAIEELGCRDERLGVLNLGLECFYARFAPDHELRSGAEEGKQ